MDGGFHYLEWLSLLLSNEISLVKVWSREVKNLCNPTTVKSAMLACTNLFLELLSAYQSKVLHARSWPSCLVVNIHRLVQFFHIILLSRSQIALINAAFSNHVIRSSRKGRQSSGSGLLLFGSQIAASFDRCLANLSLVLSLLS